MTASDGGQSKWLLGVDILCLQMSIPGTYPHYILESTYGAITTQIALTSNTFKQDRNSLQDQRQHSITFTETLAT